MRLSAVVRGIEAADRDRLRPQERVERCFEPRQFDLNRVWRTGASFLMLLCKFTAISWNRTVTKPGSILYLQQSLRRQTLFENTDLDELGRRSRAQRKKHERVHPPRLLCQCTRDMRLWRIVDNRLVAKRTSRRHLLELPPVLHRQTTACGH